MLILLMLIRDQIKKAIPNKVRCSLVVSNLNELHLPTLYSRGSLTGVREPPGGA